jgi:hypothetical protein
MKQSPMKHLLLVFQLIAAGLIVKGQAVWAPQGATWYYSYGNFAVTGYVRIKYVGDSIINGQSCKALVIDTTFTYLKNDSVFYYFNNQFYLLYDFNGQPSDVWQVAEPDTFCTEDSSATVQVDSIGTMTINATTLKWLSVNPTPNSHYGYYGQIIERIGCYDFYMFPEYVTCIADANEGGPFRCYYDSTFGLYQKESVPSCDFILGINKNSQSEQSNSFSVYPNPAYSNITVDTGKQTKISSIKVFNFLSQEVIEMQNIYQHIASININNLTNGIYYILIVTEKQNLVKKFIKQY